MRWLVIMALTTALFVVAAPPGSALADGGVRQLVGTASFTVAAAGLLGGLLLLLLAHARARRVSRRHRRGRSPRQVSVRDLAPRGAVRPVAALPPAAPEIVTAIPSARGRPAAEDSRRSSGSRAG